MMGPEELGELLERLNHGITLLWVTNVGLFCIIALVLGLTFWGAYMNVRRQSRRQGDIKNVMNVLGQDDAATKRGRG